MTNPKYAAFTALDPFFQIAQQGLAGLVDGDHYLLARRSAGLTGQPSAAPPAGPNTGPNHGGGPGGSQAGRWPASSMT
jgi:hypothetical protein